MKTINEIFEDKDFKFLSDVKEKERKRKKLTQYRWRDFILDAVRQIKQP